MNDAERTMREEQWMLTQEFLDPAYPIPPIATAFKLLDEARWEAFLRDLDGNIALRFFNPELADFSCASSWESLAQTCGVEPYDATWSIDPRLEPDVRDFCRELRAHARASGDMYAGGQKLFERPAGHTDPWVLTVYHDGGDLAPYFNESYEQPSKYQWVYNHLQRRGLWREMQDGGTTYIYRS